MLRINRISGVCFMIAGVSLALWTVVHPWGSFAGAEIGGSRQWMWSHTFHFVAAAFGLLGLLGFVEREVKTAGTFERVGFGIAFVGTILFAGTGMFTAFVWPVLAREAPQLTDLQGPFFTPPHPLILITTVSYSLGHILFGAALARAGAIRPWAVTALALGAVLLMIPPAPLSPLPWLVFPAGGVMFGGGLVALGLALRSGAPSASFRAAPVVG